MILFAVYGVFGALCGAVLMQFYCKSGGAAALAAERLRLLRLAARDLRQDGHTLLGLAQSAALSPDGTARPAALGARLLAHRLLHLADDLQDCGVAPTDTLVLRPERLDLAGLLDEAIAETALSLAPGQRLWRVSPALAGVVLLADRRAMRQVLGRVLGNAARFSGHGDCITIAPDPEPDGGMFALMIEDEGGGMDDAVIEAQAALLRQASRPQADSRGLGLGLVLARRLMLAQGGTLRIETARAVGTRVVLALPAALLRLRVSENYLVQ